MFVSRADKKNFLHAHKNLTSLPSEGCPTTGGASGCPKCFIQSARNAANLLRTELCSYCKGGRSECAGPDDAAALKPAPVFQSLSNCSRAIPGVLYPPIPPPQISHPHVFSVCLIQVAQGGLFRSGATCKSSFRQRSKSGNSSNNHCSMGCDSDKQWGNVFWKPDV